MGSNNTKGRKALALMAAAATLASGMGASTAYAGGEGGNRPGTGGDLTATQFWQYKDDASGSWGSSTDINSVSRAMAAAGVTMDDSSGKAAAALKDANDRCVAGFQSRHPGEGDGDCRVVAVGAVTATNMVWNGTGIYAASVWKDNWNKYVAPGDYNYAGTRHYKTSTAFDDDPSMSVDKLMEQYVSDTASIVIIALDKYQPAPADTAPATPTKTIGEHTSADSMTNTTTITSGTGKGGIRLDFTDTFDPHGQTYTVSNLKVTDTTSGTDMTGSYTFNTADGATPADDRLTATWNGGSLPDDHEFALTFDVTVATPEISLVSDTGHVSWQGSTKTQDLDTPNREFATWKPNPDKSWVKWNGTGWDLVTDPTKSNTTGGDDAYYLDGDKVASAVNATVAKDLVPDQLSAFQIIDDYANADYLFDADGKDSIRVYEQDADTSDTSSIDGIDKTGTDVTDQYDITVEGTRVTATAKASHLKELTGMAKARQVTLLVPGTINMANGGGAAQARKDMGVAAGEETAFCTAGKDGQALTNSGKEIVNNQAVSTNEPKICGYVPPVSKDVLAEASHGGDQDSVQGKVVLPGQKVEYQLQTEPKLPGQLAYDVADVKVTDTYDEYLTPDKQTLEVRDLSTGKTISKKRYTTKWSDSEHSFQLVFDDDYVKANWGAGSNPRLLVRFEGTVNEDAPTDHKIGNQWGLTLNNSLTPSNRVYNIPADLNPTKEDTSSKDPTVSIDGKTLMLGDTGNYVVTLDAASLSDTAYRVQRLGVVDDYDDEYVSVDQTDIEVLDSKGQDVTDLFNIQIKDGVAYVFAKTVDTEIAATGETVKGDPQPDDLAEYSTRKLDALKDPSIDQTLLGQQYKVVMPYTVIKVTDGYTVANKATQITNNQEKETNEVSNPVKEINPSKDVTVKVGGESIDGQSVYRNHTFLYQLDSSVIPADRAYPQVDQWRISDRLNTEYDVYTGQWAVYAATDLYRDGEAIAKAGERIGGSGFDSSALGGDLFDATYEDGTFTVEATELYRQLVGADNEHEHGWRAYLQCKRLKVSERVENQFVEHFNDTTLESNVVWTRTPDMTPSIHVEKYDVASGETDGDRDDVKDALKMDSDSQQIAFKITNTSKVDEKTGEGAYYLAKDLDLSDHTIAGAGEVVDLKYPADWDTLVLAPGESVTVTGTLKGVSQGGNHTDRVKVTGTPLVECPVTDQFGDQTGTDQTGLTKVDVTMADGSSKTLCEDTRVESNTDDWSGYRTNLAFTGAAVGGVLAIVAALGGIGTALTLARRKAAGSRPRAAHSAK